MGKKSNRNNGSGHINGHSFWRFSMDFKPHTAKGRRNEFACNKSYWDEYRSMYFAGVISLFIQLIFIILPTSTQPFFPLNKSFYL